MRKRDSTPSEAVTSSEAALRAPHRVAHRRGTRAQQRRLRALAGTAFERELAHAVAQGLSTEDEAGEEINLNELRPLVTMSHET